MSSVRTKFVVEGRGEFPYDMLRYDGCWPRDTEDALKLATPKSHAEYSALRQITLTSDYRGAPTVGRWASFNWRVGSQEKI